jgi:hypothetical protein
MFGHLLTSVNYSHFFWTFKVIHQFGTKIFVTGTEVKWRWHDSRLVDLSVGKNIEKQNETCLCGDVRGETVAKQKVTVRVYYFVYQGRGREEEDKKKSIKLLTYTCASQGDGQVHERRWKRW